MPAIFFFASFAALLFLPGSLWLAVQVVFQPLDLVHAFVQDRHDASFTVAEEFPIDDVLLVAAEIAVDAEPGGDGAAQGNSRAAMALNLSKRL